MAGRTSSYKKEYCDTVVRLMNGGETVEEVCASIGICKDTFYRWVKKYKAFSDAHKKGRTAFIAYHTKIYRQAMLGFPIPYRNSKGEKVAADPKMVSPAMMIFYMKAHCGWKEERDTPNTNNITVNLSKDMSKTL